MGDKYAGAALQTAITSDEVGLNGVAELKGGTGNRMRFYDLMMGHDGTPPVDFPVHWIVNRTTGSVAVGTGVTEEALDPAAAAATGVAIEELTTAPTLATTPLLDFPLNTRATFRWVSAPDGAIVTAATTDVGLLINAASTSYASIARANFHWEE